MARWEIGGRTEADLTRRRLLQVIGGGVGTAAVWPMGILWQSASAMQGGQADTLVYSSTRPLFSLDPRRIEYQEEQTTILPLVYEPLTMLDNELNVVPRLATEWEAIDATTWQFRLREGVSFHNGEPFTAESVKFTMDELRELGAEYPRLSNWGEVMPEVEIVDDYTVNIVTAIPVLLAPRRMAIIGMMPPIAGAELGYAESPIGTGPYRFVSHQQDVELMLEANPEYWGEVPTVPRFAYRPIPDSSARFAAVQTGDVDVAGDVAPDLIPVLEAAEGVGVMNTEGVRLGSYNFNFRNADSPISDVNVRRALTQAIDGESLIQNVLSGAGNPLLGPVPSVLWGSADAGGFPPFDPDAARAALEAANYPEDYELVIIYTEGEFLKDLELTEAILAMLTDVGVNARIETLEGGAYIERRQQADYDIAINGAGSFGGDLVFPLALISGPIFGYSNEAVQSLVSEAQETVDQEQALELFDQAQKQLWDDVPYLWGFTQASILAVRDRVQNLVPLPNGTIEFQNAAFSE